METLNKSFKKLSLPLQFIFVAVAAIVLIASLCLWSLFSSSPEQQNVRKEIETFVYETIEQYTAVPSHTPFATFTDFPVPSPIIISATLTITETSTSGPSPTLAPTNTPTITFTPMPTSTVSPTKDQLTRDHFDGIYGVGIDIAPGRWEVRDPVFIGAQPDCYWARYNSIGNIIEDSYGQVPPFVIYVYSSDTLVEFDHCRRVVYLGP